jgi:hypothetical protein
MVSCSESTCVSRSVRRALIPSISLCSVETNVARSSAETLALLSGGDAPDTPRLYTSAIEHLKRHEQDAAQCTRGGRGLGAVDTPL